MKKLASLFVCLLIIKAYSQDIPAVNNSKFQFGVNFSSDMCYRTLKNNNGSSSNDEIIKGRNSSEIPKFGYTTGVNLAYNLNKTIGMEIGLQLSNKGYQTETNDCVYGESIDWPYEYLSLNDPSIPSLSKLIHSYYHIEVPLKANFTFGKKKIRFIASAGVVTNFLVDKITTGVFLYSDGSKKRESNSSDKSYYYTNFSPMASFGIDWKITPKMDLKAEPTVRYGIIKIIDAPVTEYLWNCGLNVGCYYRL
jgi:hypothetical protein